MQGLARTWTPMPKQYGALQGHKKPCPEPEFLNVTSIMSSTCVKCFSFGLILIAVTANFILEYSSNEINLKTFF